MDTEILPRCVGIDLPDERNDGIGHRRTEEEEEAEAVAVAVAVAEMTREEEEASYRLTSSLVPPVPLPTPLRRRQPSLKFLHFFALSSSLPPLYESFPRKLQGVPSIKGIYRNPPRDTVGVH